MQQGETQFEKWEREDKAEKRDPWSPFASRDEWDLSRFMVKNMGQNKIEEFLGLGMVSLNQNLVLTLSLTILVDPEEWVSCEI